jgi:hypothetical protein
VSKIAAYQQFVYPFCYNVIAVCITHGCCHPVKYGNSWSTTIRIIPKAGGTESTYLRDWGICLGIVAFAIVCIIGFGKMKSERRARCCHIFMSGIKRCSGCECEGEYGGRCEGEYEGGCEGEVEGDGVVESGCEGEREE